MKRNPLKIFIKLHLSEIIPVIFNIVAAYFAFRFKDNESIVFWLSCLVFVGSLIALIYIRTKEKLIFYLPMNKLGDEKDWIGRGRLTFIRNEQCFEITESNVGYVFPKTTLWDDYRYEFDFKIVNKAIAFIVRAVNLSNYIMFQYAFDGINPHIRLNGEWIVKHHKDSGVNLSFDKRLNPDTWYRGNIICEKRSIRLVIFEEGHAIFDRHWKIPEGMVTKLQRSAEDGSPIFYYQNIDFDFGAAGVRDHGDERGFVKEVYLEKL